ncbi:MAG: tetratricopeptide repeat protein [Opitutaceae bacterium]
MPVPSSFVAHSDRRTRWSVAALLALGVLAVYANSLGGPFVFDDIASIRDNPTIRQLWPLSVPLSPPSEFGLTVCNRPLLNFTLALNYAAGGLAPRGFHVVNTLIHLAAAGVAFGLARRTVRYWRRGTTPREAVLFAGTVAALWALHPLLTEAVTYIIQRGESLAGLFTLLSLYAFVRAHDGGRPWRWTTVAVLAAHAAAATKEIGVLVPVLTVLYDRTFLADSWRSVWQQRRWRHLAIASAWLLLAGIMLAGGGRGGTATLGFAELGRYWLTQLEAVAHYLRLTFWPRPLVFEYGYRYASSPLAVLPAALLVFALGAATLRAAWRGHPAGFLGCWFFLGLAPASLMPNTIQVIVEHRMYLPMLAPLTLLVGFAFAGGGVRWLIPCAALALTGGALTVVRNRDYRTELALWSDTVAKCPEGARAWAALGAVWYEAGEFEKAVDCSQRAVRLDPALPAPHINLGLACEVLGRDVEAVDHFTDAVRLNPRFAVAQTRLAFCLVRLGREAEATARLHDALALDPGDPQKHVLLGVLLERRAALDAAFAAFARALALDPRCDQAEGHWGAALLRRHRPAEALPHLERALALREKQPVVHEQLATALLALGRADDAFAQYQRAVALAPELLPLRVAYGLALARARRWAPAREQFAAAVAAHPDSAQAHTNLGNVLTELGEFAAARQEYHTTLRLEPGNALAHFNLANVLLRFERFDEARDEFAAALRLDASLTRAREMLEQMEPVLGPAR